MTGINGTEPEPTPSSGIPTTPPARPWERVPDLVSSAATAPSQTAVRPNASAPPTDSPKPADRLPSADVADLDPADGDLVYGPQDQPTEQKLLAKLFSARSLALGASPTDRLWGWLGPGLVALVAAILRVVNLGFPGTLVFDETYYVKAGYTLLRSGFEAEWPEEPNAQFESGTRDIYLNEGDYVVHPPFGKWMIALGMKIGGPSNPWSWRLMSAIVGVIAVFLIARAARNLFGSTVFGMIAGGLFAIDGVAIVHSRTGLLDGFLMFWVVVAFALLIKDRDWSRRRLAARTAVLIDSGKGVGRDGPVVGFRWYRFAAAVALGLACGTKWSGLYFVAVFCLMSVAWDASARRAIGARQWHIGSFLLDAFPAAAIMLPTVAITYLLTWWGWFTNPLSYGRQWWVDNPGTYPDWVPNFFVSIGEALRSLIAYHQSMLTFHTGLNTPHTYMANPWGWLLQLRPTSFYWRKTSDYEGGCGVADCTRAITSIGNPLIWWLATAAIAVALWALFARRDWRAVAVLSGIVAGWVPWLFFPDRTIFTFYTIAFAPWMYLTLTFAFVVIWELVADNPRERRVTSWIIGGILGLIFAVSVFFYPIWTGMNVPYQFWQAHMWLKSWI